jgi:putative solute:sodium symporter small subunit
MTDEQNSDSSSNAHLYWRANRRLILGLLTVWALASFGCGILWVQWLNQFSIGSLPLGFWFAQQGSILVFVVLIFLYAILMDRIDRKYGVQE